MQFVLNLNPDDVYLVEKRSRSRQINYKINIIAE